MQDGHLSGSCWCLLACHDRSDWTVRKPYRHEERKHFQNEQTRVLGRRHTTTKTGVAYGDSQLSCGVHVWRLSSANNSLVCWFCTGSRAYLFLLQIANTCSHRCVVCADETRRLGWYRHRREMLGDWPFPNDGTLFGPTHIPLNPSSAVWQTLCRERKCCWSPVDFLGWPSDGSRRTECRPAGTCTVPPQSRFVRWTWSGLQNV